MSTSYTFTVYGDAVPQGSKVRTQWGVREANSKLRPWRDCVAAEAGKVASGELLTGPILLELTFVRPRPKSHYGTGKNEGKLKDSAPQYPTTKPDSLKLGRAVEDALTGILWRDDSQVCWHVIEKTYGTPARCEVQVTECLT